MGYSPMCIGPAQSPGTFDLFDLVADAEVARQEGDPAQADTKADLASGLSNQLRTLRGRLLVFLNNTCDGDGCLHLYYILYYNYTLPLPL